jgi:hypothetical protein
MQWSSLVWISLLSPPLVWWSNLSLFSKFYCWIGVNSRTYTGGEKWYNAENVHYARGMLNMIGVTTKSQLTHCFRNIFSKISTPALTGKYRGVLSSAFNQLKYLFTEEGGLVVFLGITWRVVPVVGIRLTKV